MKKVLKIILFLFVIGVYVNLVTIIIPSETASSVFGLGGVALISYLFFKKKKKTKTKNVSVKKPQKIVRTFKQLDLMLTGYSHDSIIKNMPRQAYIEDLEEFDFFILKREPENEHDTNAILAIDRSTGADVGYVSAKENKYLAKFLDEGGEYEAYLKKLFKTKQREYIPILIVELKEIVS